MSSRHPTILILTPMKSASGYLDSYFSSLGKLTYSHERLSLGILEGDSIDDTLVNVQRRVSAGINFRRITVLKKDFGFHIPNGLPRYSPVYQATRRALLARARNHLLFRALED